MVSFTMLARTKLRRCPWRSNRERCTRGRKPELRLDCLRSAARCKARTTPGARRDTGMPAEPGQRRRIRPNLSRVTWNRRMMVRRCCTGVSPRRVRLRRHRHLRQLRRRHRLPHQTRRHQARRHQARLHPRRPTMIGPLCIGGMLNLRHRRRHHLRLRQPRPRRILLLR